MPAKPSSITVSLTFIVAVLATVTLLSAQNTRPVVTRPTTANGAVPLTGHITGVRGLVEVKVNEKAPWTPAKEGMIIDEGGEFRTGPRSAVQIVIDPDQIITLDRLGTIKLLTAVRQASGKLKTDIGMKYGRTRYDISAGGLEHESTIRSPNSTLAVRGTKVSLTDTRPFPPEAVSLIGRAEFQSFKREVVAFGGKNKAKIDSAQGTAASTAFSLAVVDPSISLARDPAEQALLADVLSRGATITLDRQTGFRTVSGGTVPTDQEIVSLLPGNLNFVLRWGPNANLDLLVGYNSSKSNGVLYPDRTLFTNADGGKIPFDHQGGPHGGFEIASFPADFPRTSYGIGANHISGPTVNATLQAYLNGKLVPILTFDNQGMPVVNTTITTQVSHLTPQQAMTREASALGIVDLSQVTPASAKAPRHLSPAHAAPPTAGAARKR
jgi:hypothetical protein